MLETYHARKDLIPMGQEGSAITATFFISGARTLAAAPTSFSPTVPSTSSPTPPPPSCRPWQPVPAAKWWRFQTSYGRHGLLDAQSPSSEAGSGYSLLRAQPRGFEDSPAGGKWMQADSSKVARGPWNRFPGPWDTNQTGGSAASQLSPQVIICKCFASQLPVSENREKR